MGNDAVRGEAIPPNSLPRRALYDSVVCFGLETVDLMLHASRK